jgi:Leucine-rich repeat (LRR) protein
MTSFAIANEQTNFWDLLKKIEKVDKLTSLSLDQVTIDGDEDDMQKLARYLRGSDLESVSFRNVVFTDSTFDLTVIISGLLVSADKLKLLKLEKCKFSSSSLACIAFCSSLKTLQVPGNNLTDEDAVKIAEGLGQSSSIDAIDVSNNELTDLGCHAFSVAIKKNNHVHAINIEGNVKISSERRNSLGVSVQQNSAMAA